MRQQVTFVVRMVVDGGDQPLVRGHIQEPANPDGWSATFSDAAELWALIRARLARQQRGPPAPKQE
jgi:hypothetical protein